MQLPADTCGADSGIVAETGSQLTNGEALSGGDNRIQLSQESVFADVTGDGLSDGVLVVRCIQSANNGWQDIVFDIAGGPSFAIHEDWVRPSADLPADATINQQWTGATVSGQEVTVTWTARVPDDPRCCPSYTGASTGTVDANGFHIKSTQVTKETADESGTEEIAATGVSREAVENMQVPSETCGEDTGVTAATGTQLTNGEAFGSAGEVIVLGDDSVFTDLDGDGLTDGVLNIECSSGGAKGWRDVVFVPASGQAFVMKEAWALAGVDLPADAVLAEQWLDATVDGDLITVTWQARLPGDAGCCPSYSGDTVGRIADGTFQTVSSSAVKNEY